MDSLYKFSRVAHNAVMVISVLVMVAVLCCWCDMRNDGSAFLRAIPAMSQAIDARTRRKLFFGVTIVGTAVLVFAVTLQSLLTDAQERRASAAAKLMQIKRHG